MENKKLNKIGKILITLGALTLIFCAISGRPLIKPPPNDSKSIEEFQKITKPYNIALIGSIILILCGTVLIISTKPKRSQNN